MLVKPTVGPNFSRPLKAADSPTPRIFKKHLYYDMPPFFRNTDAKFK